MCWIKILININCEEAWLKIFAVKTVIFRFKVQTNLHHARYPAAEIGISTRNTICTLFCGPVYQSGNNFFFRK